MAHELSQRQLRVGQEIRKVIATALEKGEVRSPEIAEAFITITQVVMSPDLKYATVYLMTLNGKNLGVILEQLNAEKWVFKKLVASKLKLRFTPDINFRVDDSILPASCSCRNSHGVCISNDRKKRETRKESIHHRKRQMQCDKCLRHRRTLPGSNEQSEIPLQWILFIWSTGRHEFL